VCAVPENDGLFGDWVIAELVSSLKGGMDTLRHLTNLEETLLILSSTSSRPLLEARASGKQPRTSPVLNEKNQQREYCTSSQNMPVFSHSVVKFVVIAVLLQLRLGGRG